MYAKIFSSLWNGTLYGKADEQLVFIFLLAHADADGIVDVHQTPISGATGIPEDRVRAALDALESADPKSRSDEQGGARIERIDAHRDWGWQIVNYQRYRSLVDPSTLRAQTRERVRKHRASRVTRGNES